MTVSTEVDHNDYTGNGVTTAFPYTFRIFATSDLNVQVMNLNEVITTLSLGTDYSVTGAGSYSGGNVVLPIPLATGWKISISRDLPATQETDLRNQGKFFAEVHEDAFDLLTMLIQQSLGIGRRSLRMPTYLSPYYDATSRFIRNLKDPVQDSDAATKGWVDLQYSIPTSEAKQAAAEAKAARDESVEIAEKFGDMDGAIAAAESARDAAAESANESESSAQRAETAAESAEAIADTSNTYSSIAEGLANTSNG